MYWIQLFFGSGKLKFSSTGFGLFRGDGDLVVMNDYTDLLKDIPFKGIF